MKNKDSSKYMGGNSSKSKSKANRKRKKISRLKYIFLCGPLQNGVITLPLDGQMVLQNSVAIIGIQLWPLLMADCFWHTCFWHFPGCW